MRRRGIRKGAAYLIAAAALSLAGAQVAVAQGPTDDQDQKPPTGNQPPAGQPPTGQQPPGAGNADLSIELKGPDHDGSQLDEGERTIYEARIVNHGPGTARGVQATVGSPGDFDLDEVNHEGECQTNPDGQGRMVCSYGDLPAGAELVLKFRGAFRHDGHTRTRVYVESLTADPDPSNNHDRQGSRAHENEVAPPAPPAPVEPVEPVEPVMGGPQDLASTVEQSGFSGFFGADAPLTDTPYTFPAQDVASCLSIQSISVTLTLDDGDTGAGEFDEGDLTLGLDGIDTGIELDGFPDGQEVTLTITGSPNNAAAILVALKADNELDGSILDADPGDNTVDIPASFDTTLEIDCTP